MRIPVRLSAAAATLAIIAVPSIAMAAGHGSSSETVRANSDYAYFETELEGGRSASASLSEYVVDGTKQGSLHVFIPEAGGAVTYQAELTDAQVEFARNLDYARAVDVPVTWTRHHDGVRTTGHDVVSVQFTGVGKVTRSATHGTMCGSGDPGCQSVRVTSQRAALGTVEGLETDLAGGGEMYLGKSVDTKPRG